ncbi:ABC transporter permease [Heyndrickxia acidiproducens]|jgi:ABC-2 type transport system permease protein|uniref:ABC transporter permease n=1 Tax=Heyndrickxia acidiproducens TaxID=1121084 RepID=UPI000379EE41|nr:ABC transporter permease subunit [Heyndrickxia acidiproducens]
MMGLIQNEWMKIFARKSSWIYMILIVAFVLIAAIFYNKMYGKDDPNWRSSVQKELAQNQQLLKKDPEKNAGLAQNIRMNQDYLKYNINPKAHSNWHFMNSVIISLGSFVTLFSIIICSANVSAEFATGTIKQLMIRPHQRWKILLSKYIAVTLYSILLLIVLFIAGYLIGMIFQGSSGFNTKFIEQNLTGGSYSIKEIGPQFLKKAALFLPSLVMVTAIAFMLSTLFKNQALAVGIGIFMLFITNTLGGILLFLIEKYDWMKYLIFPHMDLSIYAYQHELTDGVTLGFSLSILAVYYLVFMVLSFWYFQKRDISY